MVLHPSAQVRSCLQVFTTILCIQTRKVVIAHKSLPRWETLGVFQKKKKKKGRQLKKEAGEEVEQTRYSTVEAFSCQSLWYIVAVVTHSQGFRLPRSFLDVVLGRGT